MPTWPVRCARSGRPSSMCWRARRSASEQAERRQLDLVRRYVDRVVLARFMQIVIPQFLDEVGCPLINIHHSFLPAFIRAARYRRAEQRGVTLVGATAH